MEGGYRSVIYQAVVATNNAEADDVALFVKDLEPLGASRSGKARDDMHFAEGAHVAVPNDDVAALDEVFIGLRVIKTADDGPYGRDGGGDALDHGGATLVWANGVSVAFNDGLRYLCGTWYWCMSL